MLKEAKVVLVSPPISLYHSPCFGLSLLKAALTKEHISCYIDYASIYYLNAIGRDVYKIDWLSMDGFFVEYIFALVAGIKVPYSFEKVFQWHMDIYNPYNIAELGYDRVTEECFEVHKEAALRCIRIAKEETERTVERILAKNPKIVGCSAIMSQINASLAILKRVKELRPDIITIMGGYHCFGESGVALIKEYPYLDYVFTGESDDLIAPFCASILKDEEPKLESGILKQGGPYPKEAPHRVLPDMDLAPIPDYSDYLELLEAPEGQKYIQEFGNGQTVEDYTIFLFEASRGCWWGAKSACTFCGLNGALKKHRRKSPELFLQQLEQFMQQYPVKILALTDTVLPLDYMEKVMPVLAQRPMVQLASEIRAVMSEADIALLSKAGFIRLLVGVESLSEHILQLMHKGTLVINNLANLKYCMKHHIDTVWNLLTGFPGERAEDYQEQIDLLPLIEHFNPPMSHGPIVYVRNNEYVNNPEKYGIKLRPSKGMYAMSPCNEEYVRATATAYELLEPLVESQELKEKRNEYFMKLDSWKNQGKRYLDMRKHADYLKIIDTRACRTSVIHKLCGVEQSVYLYCEEPRLESMIFEAAELKAYTAAEIEAALAKLVETRLMIKMKNTYMALAIEISAVDYLKRHMMQI